jgi:hypothetical protein
MSDIEPEKSPTKNEKIAMCCCCFFIFIWLLITYTQQLSCFNPDPVTENSEYMDAPNTTTVLGSFFGKN